MTDKDRRHTKERKEFIKEAMREVMKEWLDDKFRQFGKWSLAGLGAVLTIAIIYFMLNLSGWHHLPIAIPGTEVHK